MPTALLALLVVGWEAAVNIFDIRPFTLPAPSAVFRRTVEDWGTLAPHTWTTLKEAVFGFGFGVLVGVVLAVLIASSRLAQQTLYPLLIASQAVPKLAVAPLFTLWLGYGIAPKVVITVLLVFFPVAVTTAEGLMSVDQRLVDVLRTVRATRRQMFFKVRMPYAIPHLMSGLRIGITLAVVGAVVGEWVGADSGLGYLIISANSRLDTTLGFAAIFVLVLMGVLLFFAVEAFGRLVAPWRRTVTPQTG